MYGSGRSESSPKERFPSAIPLRPLAESFSLGDPVVADLAPGILSYTYFTVQKNSYVQFNLSVEPQAKLAIDGRQTLAPTPTQHDFAEIVLGQKLHAKPKPRLKRAIQHYGYPEQVCSLDVRWFIWISVFTSCMSFHTAQVD